MSQEMIVFNEKMSIKAMGKKFASVWSAWSTVFYERGKAQPYRLSFHYENDPTATDQAERYDTKSQLVARLNQLANR